jgi:hypothetical protein
VDYFSVIPLSSLRELSDEEQTLAYRFAHVALPEDAIGCDPWEWHGGQDWRRYFLTREWDVNGIWVSVAGEQNHHGDVKRWMHVGGEDQCTTSDRQRLIAVLIEAGRLLDALG